MTAPALILLWCGILGFCWVSSLVVAFHLGRSSLERDAMYEAFQAVIQKAGQTNAMADSLMREIRR